ncbi:MAG: efflux transporter periplasmic adaptor subunit, partial [bacterium]|nr:efflux transporter periplasmic adaptor subunit [bacterium]
MPNKKTLAVTGIAVIGISLFVWQGLLKEKGPSFILEKVKRGNISQEVSETGKVKKSEDFNLNFQESGRIENIYVKVGELVKGRDILA